MIKKKLIFLQLPPLIMIFLKYTDILHLLQSFLTYNDRSILATLHFFLLILL